MTHKNKDSNSNNEQNNTQNDSHSNNNSNFDSDSDGNQSDPSNDSSTTSKKHLKLVLVQGGPAPATLFSCLTAPVGETGPALCLTSANSSMLLSIDPKGPCRYNVHT